MIVLVDIIEQFEMKTKDASCYTDEVIATQPGCHENLMLVSSKKFEE